MSSAASHTPAYVPTDLDTCDREPIHVPGAIQPHGVLLALDHDTLTAVMVSANTGPMLGVAVEEALGRPLSAFVGSEAAIKISVRIRERAPGEPLIVTLPADLSGSLAGREIDVNIHSSGGRVVVELETLGRPRSTLMTYQSARSAMARLAAGSTVEDLVTQLATEIRVLTEFDRVMVYRFDREWNGEVVAEDKRDDLNSFLGLHYPASDIPTQARRLYELNWTRLIADIGYVPVHLHPVLDPGTGQPLDLTHSTLRSVSPIHVEYLSNMGVGASMSVSLLVEGRLWGLIACHHYSGAHRPSHDARAAAEFLGQVASQQIAGREQADAREAALSSQAMLQRITARVDASPDNPLLQMMGDPELLDLVRATGVAMLSQGHFLTQGEVPDRATLERIAAGLLSEPYGQPVGTDHLAAVVPGLDPAPRLPAGVLGMASSADSWLLWLRPELPRLVDWGGDPTNKRLAEVEDGPGVRLSPRKSFALWREVVSGHSAPWEPWDLEVASRLRTHMNALMVRRSRDQIAVAESLQRSVLPSTVPSFDGVEMAVRYVPASSYQLGGDWWDAVRLEDGRIAFVIGDTAGHGVSVVGAMTQVRAALRAYLASGSTAARALDMLDALMVDLLPDQVATAAVAVWNAADRTLEVTSAGHPPPLVFSESGAQSVDRGRPLLGIGLGVGVSTVLDVPPGATLLLYTDGLVERRDTDVTTSVARLAELGARSAALGVEALTDLVLASSDSDGEDDTTVMAVRLS